MFENERYCKSGTLVIPASLSDSSRNEQQATTLCFEKRRSELSTYLFDHDHMILVVVTVTISSHASQGCIKIQYVCGR